MSEFTLAKWRHPGSLQERVYINADDLNNAGVKVFVFPTGAVAQVRHSGDLDQLPSWYTEEAEGQAMGVPAYIYRLALEDAGLPKGTILFKQVWAAAE